jgi:putative NIF3 family GTP cyclohydrolase 1 type 2
MKLGDIYKQAVRAGMDADPRGEKRLKKVLADTRKEYDGLKEKEREFFDMERLDHPFHDTRIAYGSPDVEVKSMLVGVDMEVGELVLADRLREKRSLDLVFTHHPEGRALTRFYDVMWMQADVLHSMGVPITVAEGILKDRIKQVANRILPVNHTRASDAARLLDLPFLCVHTPADNMVTRHLQDIFDTKSPESVGEVMELLMEVPEYRHFAALGVGPEVVAGSEKSRCGRVMVDMTGGTEGSKEAFEKLARTEVGTIVGMHMSEDNLKEAEKNYINVVIAGHISSDTIGINLILDEIDKVEPLEIICTSGFERIRRI